MSRVRRSTGVVAGTLALGLAVVGCGVPSAPEQDWPDGTLVIARTEALTRILEQLQNLPESKLAHHAAELATHLPDCEWVEARSVEDGSELGTEIDCHPRDETLAGLARERGEADVVFALPSHDGGRVVGTLHVAANGDLEARLRVPPSAFSDARTLLRPGVAEPGPNLLSHTDELVHARLRPEDGLDIASLIKAQGQANQLFRLKSEIFAGAVLDGTWEIAIYLPESDHPMPRAALAVGFALRAPAVAAMEQFVSDLQESWPVRRSPFALGAAEGACLLDLNLLPDLAPCYVASDSALVVGWNAASLRRALDARDLPVDPPHPAGGLHVDLARFPEADATLAGAAGPDNPDPVARPYPWRRLTADGFPHADGIHVRVRLDQGDGA